MVKIKTSSKRTASLKNTVKLKANSPVKTYNPTKQLLNKSFMGKVIMECLLNNDPEGVLEVLETYLEAANKVKLSKKAKINRSTLYHSLKSKNPTIKTLAKLMHATEEEFRK